MLIVFNKFTGLAPAIADNVPTQSKATTCTNLTLRKGDLRPLRAPVATAFDAVQNYPVILENPFLEDYVSALHGSSVIYDQFRDGELGYANFNGAGMVVLNRAYAGPFTPERPDAAPVVTVRPHAPMETTGFGDALHIEEATAPPLYYALEGDGGSEWLDYQRTAVAAQFELPTATVQSLFAAVQPAIQVACNTGGVGTTTLDAATWLSELFSTLHHKTGVHREGVFRSHADIETQLLIAVRDTLHRIMLCVHQWATGAYPTADPQMLLFPCVPKVAVGEGTDVILYKPFTLAPNPTPVTQGAGIALSFGSTSEYPHGGLGLIGLRIGTHWSEHTVHTYPASTVFAGALSDALYLAAWWRAHPTGTHNNDPDKFGVPDNLGRIVPYTLGTSTIDRTNEAYSAPVPRAYCYTCVDQHGRESRPSEPTVVTGQGEAGTHFTHTVTVASVPATCTAVVVYRAASPHDASSAESLAPVWQRVATVSPQEIALGVDMPPVSTAGYSALTTADDEPHPDVPTHLRLTEAGHAVCTDAAGAVLYVSTRHTYWSFPYARRIEMPAGVTIVAIEVEDDVVYIGTNRYPIVVLLGADNGVDGLQYEIYAFTHFNYGCPAPRSFVRTGWGVAYWANVGLVVLSKKQATVVTKDIIDDDQVAAYTPTCAAYHRGMYFAFNDTGVYIFDIPDPSFGDAPTALMTHASVPAKAALTTATGRLLLLPPNAAAFHEWDWINGALMPVVYETYKHPLPHQQVITALKVRGAGLNVVVECRDATGLRWTRTVTSTAPVRVPPMRLTETVALRVTGTFTYLTGIEIASTMQELSAA